MDDSTSQSGIFKPFNNTTNERIAEAACASRRIPLGMQSFDADARERFGQSVRLAMAFMDGAGVSPHMGTEDSGCQSSDASSDGGRESRPVQTPLSESASLARQLKQLGQNVASGMARQLELLVRFDELKGWESSGARHCVAWMNLELSISTKLGWEYLRVGRKLRGLPITTALFRDGKLTWSTVRLISRVADSSNERVLCHAALDASVSEVERLCTEYRWQQDQEGDGAEQENARSLQQIDARSFSWQTVSNGNTLIKLALPAERAQAFLNSVEQALAQLDETDDTMTQRRADAAVLMAENSLQSAGREMATADRYQVIVSVDAAQLREHEQPSARQPPARHPTVHGAGPIARETARRLACDCSVSTVTLTEGEPTDIGRKSRLWTPAMARAIKNRDQHCQFPGCTQTRHLQIHHIQHWADGGSTCVDNGVCLCAHHHTVVHEGGYRIEFVNRQTHGAEAQFIRQQYAGDDQTGSQSETEQQLRNDRESFELLRRLSPDRFRFRVVDQDGQDIRDAHVEESRGTYQSTRGEQQPFDAWWKDFQNSFEPV